MIRSCQALISVLCVAGLLASPLVVARAQDTPDAPVPTPGSSADADEDMQIVDISRRTERAIEMGLESLVAQQREDGGWKNSNTVGVTSLCLIAFMINGHFPHEKPYGETMERGLDFLLRESKSGMLGYMGTNMYSHGLATLALSELWGMTDRDDEIRDAIKAGVDVILKAQDRSGGWRYNPEPSGADVSVTAMQLVALNSARQAGILVPDETINRAIRYVQMCRQAASGGFSYMAGRGNPGFARSAAAIVSLQMCGRHDSEEVTGGIKYLKDQGDPIFQRTTHWEYGHYYAAIGMYMSGKDDFRRWWPKARDAMLRKNINDRKNTWGQRDPYKSAMALIVLGLPYAYVPAYQR